MINSWALQNGHYSHGPYNRVHAIANEQSSLLAWKILHHCVTVYQVDRMGLVLGTAYCQLLYSCFVQWVIVLFVKYLSRYVYPY